MTRRSLSICLISIIALLSLCAGKAEADIQRNDQKHGRSVILALYPNGQSAQVQADCSASKPQTNQILDRFASIKDLALGWMGSAQGRYTRRQTLLDITAGSRISDTGYSPHDVPSFKLIGRSRVADSEIPKIRNLVQAIGTTNTNAHNHREAGEIQPRRAAISNQRREIQPKRAAISNWERVKDRANSAPAQIFPGLLAKSIPAPSAYVYFGDKVSDSLLFRSLDSVLAADHTGAIANVTQFNNSSSPEKFSEYIDQLTSHSNFIVTTLPPGIKGEKAIRLLATQRRSNQLLIVMQEPLAGRCRNNRLLPIGIAGFKGGGDSLLSTATTRRPGLVTSTDIAPTILSWLGRRIPYEMQGRPIFRTGDARELSVLRQIEDRIPLVRSRTKPTIGATLALILVLGAALIGLRRDRQRRQTGLRYWLRMGSLSMLWFPAVTLLIGVFNPSMEMELIVTAVIAILLGTATERWIKWPYGPLLPTLIGVGIYVIDLCFNSHLIVNSVLGPNPSYGARFYGIGNELEATLPIMMMVGLAAALSSFQCSRKLALLFGLPMIALTELMAAGRLGATVGGIFTAGSGATLAVLLCLSSHPRIYRLILIAVIPVICLAVLVFIDLQTAGDAHFTHTVLSVRSFEDVEQIALRRFQLAWQTLISGAMPIVTSLVVILSAIAIYYRKYIYAPIAHHPVWTAALVGGLTSGIIGSIVNDSGPTLLVYGMSVLIAATAYVRGDPKLIRTPTADKAFLSGQQNRSQSTA